MKNGLYFILGVIFTLVIFSMENENKSEPFNANTFQTVSLKNNTDCIIVSFDFNIKPDFKEVFLFRLNNENERYSVYQKKENKFNSFSKNFQRRKEKLKSTHSLPLKLVFYYSSDQDKDHNLS